jgi:hypothetical protein
MTELTLKIITADQRRAEKNGAKILLTGVPGIGKTSLLRTLSAEMLATTLFVDIEAGDIAVADVSVASVRPRTWNECRDLACVLGGFNPAVPANAAYGEARFNELMRNSELAQLTGYQILFLDSLTAAGRLCFGWSEQQPEAGGRKDLRAVYGCTRAACLPGCTNCSTRAGAMSVSSPYSSATLTILTSQPGSRRSRAQKSVAKFQRSSTKS